MNTEIGILIPAHNEASTVGKVVREASKYGFVIVLDDGSQDNTKEKAKKEGALVFSHRENHGLGRALRTLFKITLKDKEYTRKFCKGLNFIDEIPNFKVLVTIDADGQHNPKDIPKLVKALKEKNADLVIGRRNLGMYPFYKQIGNKILAVTIRILLGIQIYDSESGYRAMKKELLRKMGLISEKYQIAMDILSEAVFNDAKIIEVKTNSPIYSGRKFIDYLLCRARYVQGVGILGGARNFLFLLKKILF